MDQAERDRRREHAEDLRHGLAEAGVSVVATSFVDNAGISRVKSVPLDRLPHLAAWGVGFSPAFDYFRSDDWVAAPASGEGPVGDQRIIPDLDRLVVLDAQPGWAWAPGERYEQSGAPYAADGRLLLRRLVDGLAGRGLTVRSALEIEWVISEGDGDDYRPGTRGPAYGLSRLAEVSDYSRDVLAALARQGVTVEQFHPEYAPGQLELSVAVEDPVGAADTSVLVRHTIRAVGVRHGLRTSFSPKVDAAGVGNGGHVHLSLWRDDRNLMQGGPSAHGLTPEGEGFAAGVLDHLRGPAGARGAVGGVVPPPGAAALGGRLPLLGAGEPRGRAALRHRFGRAGVVERQPRGQVRRPARQPLPAAGRAARRGRRRPGRRREPARARRGRPRVARRGGAGRSAHRTPSRGPARQPSTPSPPTPCSPRPSDPRWWPASARSASPRSSASTGASPELVADASRWAH